MKLQPKWGFIFYVTWFLSSSTLLKHYFLPLVDVSFHKTLPQQWINQELFPDDYSPLSNKRPWSLIYFWEFPPLGRPYYIVVSYFFWGFHPPGRLLHCGCWPGCHCWRQVSNTILVSNYTKSAKTVTKSERGGKSAKQWSIMLLKVTKPSTLWKLI